MEYLTDKDGNLLVDFMGRFERLEAKAAAVFTEIRLGKPELPHANKSEHGHYSGFYTPETVQIVAERFAKDMSFSVTSSRVSWTARGPPITLRILASFGDLRFGEVRENMAPTVTRRATTLGIACDARRSAEGVA